MLWRRKESEGSNPAHSVTRGVSSCVCFEVCVLTAEKGGSGLGCSSQPAKAALGSVDREWVTLWGRRSRFCDRWASENS